MTTKIHATANRLANMEETKATQHNQYVR